MNRDLTIDADQVYLGNNSALTLTLSPENNDEKMEGLLHDKYIFLIFDNISKDEDFGVFKYSCKILQQAGKPALKIELLEEYQTHNLFRQVTLFTSGIVPLQSNQTAAISWEVEGWDEEGTYTIGGFIANKNDGITIRQIDGKNWVEVSNNNDIGRLDFTPPARLRVLEESDAQPVKVSMYEAKREPTTDQPLWTLIRNRTINFSEYRAFIDRVMCSKETDLQTLDARNYAAQRHLPFSRVASYSMLKYATEFYLMQEAGLAIDPTIQATTPAPRRLPVNSTTNRLEARKPSRTDQFFDRGTSQEESRRRSGGHRSAYDLKQDYLEQLENEEGKVLVLPYFKVIREKLSEVPLKNDGEIPGFGEDACYGILKSKLQAPPLMELIWSYWHEEGGLVQTMNAISLRFQNVRRNGRGQDPLAGLAVDPLRPLNNLLWGYIEDERNRLPINRRNLEYQYEYGISLIGNAVQHIPVAEHRSNFLLGFHSLLRAAVEFFQQANFTTVIPDGFPLLNHLREVHLTLAEGAHNQYGDLPWAARSEMLAQQWLLARPEMREFLGGRIMVPYSEPWMDRVDNMKQLQGWNPTNITHFRDLGTFGEQLLLSIRYGSWNDPTIGATNAANWAHYWRSEIQRYVHAYKAVTGVDLASDIVDARLNLPDNDERYLQPAQLIERQTAMQQQQRSRLLNGPLPAPSIGQPLPGRVPLPRRSGYSE
ncbi:hypothetical protein [uncultured Hymenobacter sp.]|uniref:hypothetical protein n=1 Tax=uncultured Hymenobacter sp. TaxID=170016 RepID=UPI0035CB3863